MIFLQWEGSEDNCPASFKEDAGVTAPEGQKIKQKYSPPLHSEKNLDLRALWRVPRPDGRLRSVDWLVLHHLRSKIIEHEGNITAAVAVREISEACQVSRRTAQNVLCRLSIQQLIAPLPHASGSTEGRRYYLSPSALEQQLAGVASPARKRR
jgi:hypothetical protein